MQTGIKILRLIQRSLQILSACVYYAGPLLPVLGSRLTAAGGLLSEHWAQMCPWVQHMGDWLHQKLVLPPDQQSTTAE